jgi:GT2 family glycosyltransferase
MEISVKIAEHEFKKNILKSQNKALIVVLSFNGIEDTVDCLNSLSSTSSSHFDILVVDNNSVPPVASTLRNAFPEVEIIELQENLGWAGGNNVGINLGLERGYDWICLLNNDTVFPDGELAAWSKTLADSPPALLHPTIYYWDEPTVAQLKPGYNASGSRETDVQDWHGKIVMDYAYGACLAIHRSVFEKIGLFDERLFLQLEETDFYHRARDAGFISACDDAVKIFHKESRAFGGKKTPVKTYYIIRNSLLLIEKRRLDVFSKVSLIRKLYWTISTIAKNENAQMKAGLLPLAQWFFSDSSFAIATSAGIADYLKRKFGKISEGAFSKVHNKKKKSITLNSLTD